MAGVYPGRDGVAGVSRKAAGAGVRGCALVPGAGAGVKAPLGAGVSGPLGAGVNGREMPLPLTLPLGKAWDRGDSGTAVTMPADRGDKGRAVIFGVETFAELG